MSVEIEKAIEIMKPFEGRVLGGIEIYQASCKALDILFDNPWRISPQEFQHDVIKYKASPFRCTPVTARNCQYRNVVKLTATAMYAKVIEKLYGRVVVNGKTISQWLDIFCQTPPLNALVRNMFAYCGHHDIGVNSHRVIQTAHDFLQASCLAMFNDGRGFPVLASFDTIYWAPKHGTDSSTVDFKDMLVGISDWEITPGDLVIGKELGQAAFGRIEVSYMFRLGPKISLNCWTMASSSQYTK